MDISCDPIAETTLRLIISALPRNVLTDFVAFPMLPSSFLVHFLQNQQQLKNLHGRWDVPDSCKPHEIVSIAQASWLSYCTRHLNYLTLFVEPNRYRLDEDCRVFLKEARSLHTLDRRGLKGLQLLEPATKCLPTPESLNGGTSSLSKLDNLLLTNFDMTPTPKTIFNIVEFSVLKVLNITRCKHAALFIDAVATCYSQKPCVLSRLDVKLRTQVSPSDDIAVQALERLVGCVPSLSVLHLDPGRDKLVDATCLVRHGQRLRNLWPGNARSTAKPYLSYQPLQLLLQACAGLHQLAISLCEIDLGPIGRVGADFSLGTDVSLPQTELEAMLVRTTLRLHRS